ncbi:hypothetical protein BDN67DRAFT_1003738 [Paxillus ammoniavirescens]|nr:hypothetical protein BDN67DRAFT_1003738 [Paxillus ammoniavirescens]
MTRETRNTTLSWTCVALLYILVVSFGLRVYAMWSRYKAVLLICCCVATMGMPLANISGCYKTGASSVVFAIFVVTMIAEAQSTFLTTALAFYRMSVANVLEVSVAENPDVLTCNTVFYVLVSKQHVAPSGISFYWLKSSMQLLSLLEVICSFRAYTTWNRNRTVLVILC